ncbi:MULTISPECIES: hypothetical protein [Laceyella]|jgi:hypothetical protein|uniref:Uncharacterized protein n=1 Tax=Laceyella sediminis TaxID=573074 RepID=A0ABX5EU85_9BACL|nr:hypothetical protein [Laceyella sediminis]MRG29635.1 hypothetical protein [Laceyella tengchongensis]PRZ17302.1 hypothetical protein CLV36_101406 [Laceyella sediminis]
MIEKQIGKTKIVIIPPNISDEENDQRWSDVRSLVVSILQSNLKKEAG